MYRILVALILLLGMTQHVFAYNLTNRDERTADRLISRYELKIDREGDDLRPTIITQLEKKLARFQRIGAYRLAAIYQMVINELEDNSIPNIPVTPTTTFEVNSPDTNIRYVRPGEISKVGAIRITSYNGTTELSTIDLFRKGYGSSTNIEAMWLEYNGNRVTTRASIRNSDNHIIFSFLEDDKYIYAGNSKTFDLMMQSKSDSYVRENSTYSFFTKKECITIRNSGSYSCGDDDRTMQFIGSATLQKPYTPPVITKATYRLIVDGVEKSRLTNISRSSADLYCQRERGSYSNQTIECIWNNITLYKEEAAKRIYQGYLDGKLFITTEQITKSEALTSCLLNSKNNPQSSIRCAWNDIEIYSRKAPTPPVIDKPNIVLSNSSPAITMKNTQEEIKLLQYAIFNAGKKKFQVSTHNVELILSDTSANKSDFLIKSYVNGELVDTSNGASHISNSFPIDAAKRANIIVSITAPKTYSGTLQFILKSVSANNDSSAITHDATLKSSIVTIKPFVEPPKAIPSLKMMQVSSITQPLSITGGSLGIWKYQTFDNVSPYTSTFNILVNNPNAKKVSIDLYMNGKLVENFVNHSGELNINGGNFGILQKNTSATIEFRQAKDSEIEAKDIKITLIQVEYGDSTGDGKVAR